MVLSPPSSFISPEFISPEAFQQVFSLAPFPVPCARSRVNKPYTINLSSYLIVGIFLGVVGKSPYQLFSFQEF
ncbi:hypothetical protein MSMTP_0745 [Methanosarcina sp. MTP4]|nr:hypothetical protein MSMTP_0745 [Methanosarcina sp. MTP4]